MRNRLQAWLRATRSQLKRNWWWLLISLIPRFTWNLLYARVLDWANAAIDKNSKSWIAYIPRVIVPFKSPIVVAVLAFLFVLLVLITHAYYETRTVTKAGETLKEKTISLADELLTFLQECGPRPTSTVTKEMTAMDILNANSEEIGPWVDKIHYTYFARFKDRVLQIVNELHAIGIGDHQLDVLIEPQVQNEDRMRTIAERLHMLAGRIRV